MEIIRRYFDQTRSAYVYVVVDVEDPDKREYQVPYSTANAKYRSERFEYDNKHPKTKEEKEGGLRKEKGEEDSLEKGKGKGEEEEDKEKEEREEEYQEEETSTDEKED